MIQTLRKKFVATNMILVSIVLAVVFGVLLCTSANSAKQETINALRMAVEQQSGPKPIIYMRDNTAAQAPPTTDAAGAPDPSTRQPYDKHFTRTPVFLVLTDAAGTILESDTSAVNITDETLTAVTAAALAEHGGAAQTATGTLQDPALRYLVQPTPEGLRIAFADRSAETAALQSLALQSAIIGLLALAAFFGISVFLARRSLQPVEKAWQQQRQFVADASHELKTPLTVILANAGILASHPAATVAEEQKWVDGIQEEAARMKQLVDELLFLARADALRAPAVACAVNYSNTVESAALTFESVAFERGVTLAATVTPGLEVLGDGKQLAQLVQILLDNACKYAGPGGNASLTLTGQQNNAVLKVTNSGPTLTAEEISHLFERFYRTDAARTRGGYGLGLAIAQSIAQSHHGHITADSKDGQTTFTLTLPLLKPAK